MIDTKSREPSGILVDVEVTAHPSITLHQKQFKNKSY